MVYRHQHYWKMIILCINSFSNYAFFPQVSYYFPSLSFPVRCKSYVSIVSIDTQPVRTVLFMSRNVHPKCITTHCSDMCGVDTFMWALLKWEIGCVPLLFSYKLNYLRSNAKAEPYRNRERRRIFLHVFFYKKKKLHNLHFHI